MKKRTGVIIAVVITVVVLIAGVSIYAFVSGRDESDKKPGGDQPNKPDISVDKPDKPAKPDDQGDKPDQPMNPGGQSVVVYVPDEQGETLTPVGTDAEDDSDQALVDALIAAKSLPEGVKVQSSSVENGVLQLDMNAAYQDAVRSLGTAGEQMLVYALVNTFAQARGVEQVLITVDGAPLESGHDVYDYPLEPMAN